MSQIAIRRALTHKGYAALAVHELNQAWSQTGPAIAYVAPVLGCAREASEDADPVAVGEKEEASAGPSPAGDRYPSVYEDFVNWYLKEVNFGGTGARPTSG